MTGWPEARDAIAAEQSDYRNEQVEAAAPVGEGL